MSGLHIHTSHVTDLLALELDRGSVSVTSEVDRQRCPPSPSHCLLVKHDQAVTQPVLRRRPLCLIGSHNQVVAATDGRSNTLTERPVFVLGDDGLRRLGNGIDCDTFQ